MGNEFKAEARKQYLKYFSIWFIAVAVLAVITLGITFVKGVGGGRGNDAAPVERVYDYADVLTDTEEQMLRDYIAEKEPEIQADIVLVTVNEPMQTGYVSWEAAMRMRADDIYDDNNYGYDKVWGNGVLLLDNYYEGQEGSWLSTCGNVYEQFGDYEIDEVLDAVYYGLDDGAYNAYKAYIDETCALMTSGRLTVIPVCILIPVIVALIYAGVNLHQKKAKDTTTASTYMEGGKPVINIASDDFIRKNVVKTRIESSSGGGGGGGRGGSHRSSSGVSHGGGGRRR